MRISIVDGSDLDKHLPTNECDDPECLSCGERDCPYGEPLHYDKDGCPACSFEEIERWWAIKNPRNV